MSEVKVVKAENLSEDCSNPDVVTKYKLAGEVTQNALASVLAALKVGASTLDLCNGGDAFIKEATSKLYKKNKKLQKGVAFPTCVSVNNLVGHYSPESGNKDIIVLKAGDTVKVDLGCHIDGYIAVAAHTVVMGEEATNEKEITGRLADTLSAAYTAAEAVIRMMKPGTKNTDISTTIGKVAEAFKCSPMAGVLSHEMQRHVIDSDRVIVGKISTDHKVEEFEITANEVYAVDIVMHSGDGKNTPSDHKTTVFKHVIDSQYNLKMKASRAVFSEIKAEFPSMPFTARALAASSVMFGLKECNEHKLVVPYPVLMSAKDEHIVHVKFTVLVMPNGPQKVAGSATAPNTATHIKSELKVEDKELLDLLATSVGKKKKKKNNKKKKKKKAVDPEAKVE